MTPTRDTARRNLSAYAKWSEARCTMTSQSVYSIGNTCHGDIVKRTCRLSMGEVVEQGRTQVRGAWTEHSHQQSEKYPRGDEQ